MIRSPTIFISVAALLGFLVLVGCGDSSAEPNARPSASNLDLSCVRSASVAGIISASDADGDLLTYTVQTPPIRGTLSLAGARATYTSTAAGTSDSCTVVVNDNRGGAVVVTIAITITNAPPTFLAGQVLRGHVRVGAEVVTVLEASDVEGAAVLVRSATPAALGTFTAGTESFRYRAGSATGSEVLSLRPDDQAGGLGAPVAFTMQVLSASAPALADRLDLTTFRGANTTLGLSIDDPQGGLMTTTKVGPSPAAGTVTITPTTGGFNYSVDLDCPVGVYVVTLRATDAQGHASNLLEVRFTVLSLGIG